MERVGFSVEGFETAAGRRSALVVTPLIAVRIGSARLAELRRGPSNSAIDAQVLHQAKLHEGRVQACVFRGASDDGHGSYRFEDGLDDDVIQGLAAELLRTQLRVYRDLVALGIGLFVHVEFGPREIDAYRAAVRSHSDGCEAMMNDEWASSRERAIAEADAWILRHVVFFFQLDHAALMQRVLPDKFSMLEKRMDRARALVTALV